MVIFITGSAGLLGGALVQEFASKGHRVIAMVHRDTEIKGNDGKPIPTRRYIDRMPEVGEVMVLQGDITCDELDFDRRRLAQLQIAIDCVIHCAALVKFEAAIENLQAVNVEGTLNVAKCFPKARFVHVSTAYTCGLQNGPIKEAPNSKNGPFANGYEQSKAQAESELLKLRPDAIVARPSIVVGEYANGRIRSFDTIYRAFKFIAERRIQTVMTAQDASLNFVPIDHVVKGISALATHPEHHPAIVHLAARQAVSVEEFLQLIGKIPGLRSPRIADINSAVIASDGMAARMVKPYLSYFTRSPQFETEASERLTGRRSPQMDEAALLRQISYCVETGFIRRRPAERSSVAF